MRDDIFELPVPQKLRQAAERDCSVPVFAALTGIAEDKIRREFPRAAQGVVSVDEWKEWLEQKGFSVLHQDGCPADIVPCAHLVGPSIIRNPTDAHWIYRDEHGYVHDPSPVWEYWAANDEKMMSLQYHGSKVLTISISPCSPKDASEAPTPS
jgi:hypothetical protein